MRTSSIVATLAALAAVAPGAVAAQENLYPQAAIVGGLDARQYSFGGNEFSVDRIRQFAFPIGVLVPVGQRFSFDVGTAYATTSTRDSTGKNETFSSLTDAQVRMSYVLGTDALVASVMVNLPTGKQTTTLRQFGVASSASSSFLLFPVNSYGSGTSVTPGLAAATSAGPWNLGLAASLRFSAEYNPFNDASNKSVKYQPGIETRIRAGADRLVGQSRLTLGATFSTFGNDELRGGGFAGGSEVSPGNRFLFDVGLLAPMGRGTVSIYAWDFFRASSNSGDTTSLGNRENIFTAGVSGTFPVGPKMALEPVVEGRVWSPETGSGYLLGAGTGLRIDLSPALTFVPAIRVDFGHLETPTGASGSLTGWGLTALLRYGL